MTPPIIGPRLFGELSEDSSFVELLVVSVEVLSTASIVLDAVSVETTVDVCSCDVVCSVVVIEVS
jgi:hypothetical protein